MPYPSYNPTLVLIDAVRAAGYDPGGTPLAISYSNSPMGHFPMKPEQQDIPDMTEKEALRNHSPGDAGIPKFLPYSSDQGM